MRKCCRKNWRLLQLIAAIALFIPIFFLSYTSIVQASGAGIAGAEFLREIPGARASAMAGAKTALADDGYTLLWNPAGMSRLRQAHFSATHQEQMLDIDKETLGLSLPLWANHTVGLGGRLEHSTDYERSEFFDGGEFTNYSGSLGGYYAYGGQTGLAWGGGVKFIRERLAGYNARSYALDLGVHYKSPRTPLRLGAAVQNLGPDITFIEEGDPLPRTVRVGWAYDFHPGGYRLTVANDLIYLQPENITSTAFGGELELTDYLDFRLGYASPQDYSDDGKLHGGVGVSLGSFDFDYSLSRRENFDNQHRFTLSIRFGARPEPLPRERPWEIEEREMPADLLEIDLQQIVSDLELTYRHPLVERWNREAEIYFAGGEYEEAVELWENSLAAAPDQPQIYRRLGMAYYRLDELEKARGYLLGPVEPAEPEIDPGENYQQLNDRAEEYFEAGRYREAIGLWKRSLKINDQPRIYRRIGTAYYEIEEFERAREYMEAGER